MGVNMLTAAEARAKLISREERMLEEIERRIIAVAENTACLVIYDHDSELGWMARDETELSDVERSVMRELMRNGYRCTYGHRNNTRYIELRWGGI